MEAPPRPSLTKQWAAAALANAFTSALLNPWDVAKTQMQTLAQSTGPQLTLRSTMRRMWTTGGLKGLFLPGLLPTVVRECVYSGPRIGFYGPVRDYLISAIGAETVSVKILAAILTGSASSILSNPVDVVKIRQMSSPARYPSAAAALRELYEVEGAAGLFKGLLPSMMRGAAISVGQIATYDIAKGSLKASFHLEEGAALHVSSALVTGACASVCAAPFDLFKARAMNSSATHESMLSIFRTLHAEGGLPFSLFRGVLPAYFRLGPHTLICFPILERLRHLMGIGYL
jgi:Mitochondrial carrier protein